MNMQTAIAKRIMMLCAEHDMVLQQLARVSAVPPSTLKNIVHGVSKNPGVVTIKKLCDGLGISIIDFFDHDLFRNLEQEIR